MTFQGKIGSDVALDTVKKTIEDQGPLDAPIEIAEVNHEGDSTRIVIKFGKTTTKKATRIAQQRATSGVPWTSRLVAPPRASPMTICRW